MVGQPEERLSFVMETDDGPIEASIEEVEELASQGNAGAMFALGYCYLFGVEKELDKGRGYDLLEQAAEKDSPDAKALLCRMHVEGDYFGLDNEKAAEYALAAAEEGITDGMLLYGLALLDGAGVERDPVKAAAYIRKAMNQGNPEARNTLGCMYLTGEGVEKDEQKAFKLFIQAAKAGNVNAMYQAGACLEGGVGTVQDIPKAKEWYSKAAGKNDPEASFRLGVISYESNDDHREAFEHFVKAGLGGVPDAIYMVGRMDLSGDGTDPDRDEGVKWLSLAAASGNSEAEEVLGALGINNKDDGGDDRS